MSLNGWCLPGFGPEPLSTPFSFVFGSVVVSKVWINLRFVVQLYFLRLQILQLIIKKFRDWLSPFLKLVKDFTCFPVVLVVDLCHDTVVSLWSVVVPDILDFIDNFGFLSVSFLS